jgi:hypothetical protein
MPKRAGKGVTLGEVKTRANTCAACHAPLGTEEPIAWTWARQRIHEACMPIWAFADRGRRALGDWIAEPVGLLLERHQGRLCSSCLALALSLSLEEARQVVDITASLPGFRVLPVTCETCGRSTMALCTVPGAPTPTAEGGVALAKCTLCSQPLEDDGSSVMIGADRFHRPCSHVVLARDRIRTSRALSRQSCEQLGRARAKLDRPAPGC